MSFECFVAGIEGKESGATYEHRAIQKSNFEFQLLKTKCNGDCRLIEPKPSTKIQTTGYVTSSASEASAMKHRKCIEKPIKLNIRFWK